MNTKNTWVWFIVAAVLFASIYLLNRYLRVPATEAGNILSGLQASAVTSLEVIPAGALEIRADRTNHSWRLAKPISYAAQPAAIETLLDALQKLAPATRISAAELREQRNASLDFGFEPPQTSLVIEAGDQRWQLLIGNKTAPGDQVFLRLVGVDGAFVANAEWLKLLPRTAADWRSTALVEETGGCDTIVLTNGAKVIELRCGATNRLWRMVRPLQARADNDRINDALQQLQTARVAQFVTDDPKADLTAFGLQPADLDVWLSRGTNFISALHAGKDVATNIAQLFAKREGWSAIFMTAKEPLLPWRGTVNDFRNPHLIELNAPVAEIEVHGPNHFTLQRQGENDWKIVDEKFPADAEIVQQFIKVLAGLRVAEFVKDVVTAPDLPTYGLAVPAREICLRSTIGDTNAVIAQIAFAVQTNGIFAHRADEDFIYSITPEDFGRLPEAGWEFRARRIWNFSETNVAQITLRQNGKTRVLVRNGVNKWSLAAGSQGIINPPALEETAHRLGQLAATGWVGTNVTDPAKFGASPDNLEITVELKSGENFSVAFGAELPRANTALATVTLDGVGWAFVFPPVLYQFVLSYLTIPANVP